MGAGAGVLKARAMQIDLTYIWTWKLSVERKVAA
jgi:hypothetical protein